MSLSNWINAETIIREQACLFGHKLPSKPKTETVDILLAFEKLMMDMRKDLGHEDIRLEDGDLLKLFIDDIDSHLHQDKIHAEKG